MASATVDHRDHLHLESIPVIDLRLLSQPELFSLSLCSSAPFPSNAETEHFIPKIDRTVFNESAGSRKQTFYRLRLAAPRNYLHHPPHHSSPSSKPFSPRHLRLNPEPLDEESANALHLLKSLFNIDESLIVNAKEEELEEGKDLVPVQIEYPSGSPDLQNIPVGVVSCSRIKRKRGRPRKDEKDNWFFESGDFVAEEHGVGGTPTVVSEMANAGDVNGFSPTKRKRGRPRKEVKDNWVFESGNSVAVESGGNPAIVAVSEMANVGDVNPVSENKRRRGRPRKDSKDNGLFEIKNLVVEEKGEIPRVDRVGEVANAADVNNVSEDKKKEAPTVDRVSEMVNTGAVNSFSENNKVTPTVVRVSEMANAGDVNSFSENKKRETPKIDRVSAMANAGDFNSFSESKKRRGRPPKNESQSRVVGDEEQGIGNKIERADEGNVEGPIEKELRRRTEGMKTEKELFEFMGSLEGEWLTKNQKKRIIDANTFGNVLPNGWKLMLFVKRRGFHISIACSRYISPSGQQFVSFKEASSYLISSDGPKDSSQSTLSQTGGGSGSGVKPTSGNLSECENRATLPRMGSPRVVQKSETIKCHKCTLTFNQQDDFISHLLSSHQGAAKSTELGTSTNEDAKIKNGKFECQFCNDLFEERSSYNSHLEMHMMSNAKKVEDSVGVLLKQNNVQPFNSLSNSEMTSAVHNGAVREDALVEPFTAKYADKSNLLSHDGRNVKSNRNEQVLADENCDEQNSFCIITNNKGKVTDTAAVEPNFCLGSENVSFSANNSVSQSSDKKNVQFSINSLKEKKRETASKSWITALNAEGNIFSDENIQDRHFANFTEGMETDGKYKATRGHAKASSAKIHTGPHGVKFDLKQQSCFEGRNTQRGNFLDQAKGASAAQERGSGFGEDQRFVINNNSVRVSAGTLNKKESNVINRSGNDHSSIGFHGMKQHLENDSEYALRNSHQRGQVSHFDNDSFKISSHTVEASEPDEVQKCRGLIQDVDCQHGGLDAKIFASVRQMTPKDSQFFPSSYEKTYTCTMEEHKRSDTGVHLQPAYPQLCNNETRMNKFSFIPIEEPKHKVESTSIGNANARVGNVHENCSPIFAKNWEKFAGKNSIPGISSSTVHEPKKNKGAFENLFCPPGSEQTQVPNNLNTIYPGTAHGGSRLENFGNTRTNDIMIGFGNHARPTEDSMTGLAWKSDGGSVLLSGLADTPSQFFQPSGYYPTFDAMSHKGESEMFNINGKGSSVSGLGGLRSDSMEHMEYNFLTAQPSSSAASKVSSYDSEMALKFDSSIWLGKEALPLLPKVAGRHQVKTLCSWCGNEFYHEADDTGSQRNSMAVMCSGCRARFSRNHDIQ